MSSESSSVEHFLANFRETIETSAARLFEIPEEQSQLGMSNGKWSPKEILGHLIDSAANNHQRFVRSQFGNELVFAGYQQAEWVKVQKYNDEPWHQLIHLWKHYNLHLVHLISAIPAETLTKLRALHNLDRIAFQTVDKSEQTTLEYFVRDYGDHLRHHLAQIFANQSQ
jgi:hypothetical protein